MNFRKAGSIDWPAAYRPERAAKIDVVLLVLMQKAAAAKLYAVARTGSARKIMH